MSDRVFFSLGGLAAILMIALALVFPQGLGAKSPKPFGHPLGPIESDAPLADRKPLRARPRDQVDPNALTAPIPLPPGARPPHGKPVPSPAATPTPTPVPIG